MPQQQDSVKPLYLNLDSSFETMQKDETPFNRDWQFQINGNANLPTGTGNPSGEGQNEMALTPSRSNVEIPNSNLPTGYNKNVGTFESTLTKELYYLNYNSEGNHGLYVISGDNLEITQIVVDPALNFTLDQDGFFTEHRCTLRVRYDENKNIIEKYFIATNGKRWQLWINVLAAIATNGFNATSFPYYKLEPPLFDRRELLEYPVRPPMQPVTAVSRLNNTNGLNDVLDYGFEFCYQFIYTDGRETTVSPFSVPNIIQSQSFLANPNLIDNQWLLTLYAGSPLVEKINLFYRFTKKEQNVNAYVTWSDWYLYDTIYKFGTNIPVNYWTRTGAWENTNTNSYDSVNNTLTYIFDNTKLGQIVDQSLFTMVQTEMPILSVAMSDLGDTVSLWNNQYGYDNIPKEITDKISISVEEKTNSSCVLPLRKIRLYATILSNNGFQVGFYNSADTLGMRIGGLDASSGSIDLSKSALFDMYFGGDGKQNAYACYLKGTPYVSVGLWYEVGSDYSLTLIEPNLDYSNAGTATYISNVISKGGYFVCLFDFEVPAGVYMADIGRHNVSLNDDFRGQSTYMVGLTGSRYVKAHLLGAQSRSREMYIDCTHSDYDNWGNDGDCFLIYTPRQATIVEGYIYDNRTFNAPYELLNYLGNTQTNGGNYTDKNGFYWHYSNFAAPTVFNGAFSCSSTTSITVPNTGTGSWIKQGIVYVQDIIGSSYNINANTYFYYVKVTDSAGSIPYSNIGVSVSDGQTSYTNEYGLAILIFHNPAGGAERGNYSGGASFEASFNLIILSSASNFTITNIDCSVIAAQTLPSLVCSTSQNILYYPTYPLPINISYNKYTSLKQQGGYSVVCVLADLALRATSGQHIQDITVPSFVSRGNTNPTYLQWNINSPLNLNDYPETKDAAYFGLFVTKATNYKKYIQWVGDAITYYNSAGLAVTNPSLASFVSISITSLLNTNIQNNLNLLANYQFQQNDRIRIYDNGQGSLLSNVIDLPIQGTNYNQAAISSQLITPPANTVLPSTASTVSGVNLFVVYDNRLNQLQGKTGFWIEIYSPSENSDLTPFFQSEIETDVTVTFAPIPLFSSWMPIINGEPAVVFDGNNYFPTTGKLNYWDTYLFPRSITIPNAGVQFFTHNFESPNITDSWGYDASSGGQSNLINPYAKQMFYLDDVIKSDSYISQGLKNGLATFRNENRKAITGYGRGGVVAVKTHYQIVLAIFENDWAVMDFNFQFVYANQQGVQIANLDNNLGTPHQKIGDNYGCAYGDTSSILFNDKYALWHDKRNEGFIFCDFRQAKDVTDVQSEGRSYGIKSYYCKKSLFVSTFNHTHNTSNKIDITTGIDLDLELIYVTFRPRRNNSEDINTFINDRRNLQIDYQETFVYSINSKRWLRLVGFAPESYGTLRGNSSGRIMVSFAQGIPYTHGNLQSSSYCNFFGVNVAPVIAALINPHPEVTKTLQSISLDINNQPLWVDMIYSNLLNTFSYIPVNYVKNKEGQYYAPVLANMNSYPNPNTADNDFRSMLLDGGKMRGVWFLVRFVADLANVVNGTNVYSELNNIYYKYTVIGNTNK